MMQYCRDQNSGRFSQFTLEFECFYILLVSILHLYVLYMQDADEGLAFLALLFRRSTDCNSYNSHFYSFLDSWSGHEFRDQAFASALAIVYWIYEHVQTSSSSCVLWRLLNIDAHTMLRMKHPRSTQSCHPSSVLWNLPPRFSLSQLSTSSSSLPPSASCAVLPGANELSTLRAAVAVQLGS